MSHFLGDFSCVVTIVGSSLSFSFPSAPARDLAFCPSVAVSYKQIRRKGRKRTTFALFSQKRSIDGRLKLKFPIDSLTIRNVHLRITFQCSCRAASKHCDRNRQTASDQVTVCWRHSCGFRRVTYRKTVCPNAD